MKIENTRRLSDRIPLGVESALPGMPFPKSRLRARKRWSGWHKSALALTVLLFVAGAWLLGKG